jgi:hypothetical protein
MPAVLLQLLDQFKAASYLLRQAEKAVMTKTYLEQKEMTQLKTANA